MNKKKKKWLLLLFPKHSVSLMRRKCFEKVIFSPFSKIIKNKKMSQTEFNSATFSKETPDKISKYINVSGKNTLINTEEGSSVAIADESIDAKADGKKIFCVRVDKPAVNSAIMIGFTSLATFDSEKRSFFGSEDFDGCGVNLYSGDLCYSIVKKTSTTSSTKKSLKKQKKSSSSSPSATMEQTRRSVPPSDLFG